MKNPPVREPEPVTTCRSMVKPGEYMVLPANDRIVSSIRYLPDVGVQVMASPELGAAFVQYELLVPPATGTSRAIADEFEHFLFMLEGEAELEAMGRQHAMRSGSYAWLPPGEAFGFHNRSSLLSRLIWVRRRYEGDEELPVPGPIISHEESIAPVLHPVCDTRYLLPLETLSFDMSMSILSFQPGSFFSTPETHAMEHGLYMLEGAGIYWLNGDYVDVKAGDFVYMAPYCPQAFFVTGHDFTRYLLYKDWNLDYTEYL